MKVFWVNGWDVYYPGVDNFLASFETEEEAQAYADSKPPRYNFTFDFYEVVDISDRL